MIGEVGNNAGLASFAQPRATTPSAVSANKPAAVDTININIAAVDNKPQVTPGVKVSAPVAKVDDAKMQQRIEESVEKLNASFQKKELSVEFSTDEDTNRQVIKLRDSDTGDVYMQLPSDAVLAASKNLDKMLGIFFDDFV